MSFIFIYEISFYQCQLRLNLQQLTQIYYLRVPTNFKKSMSQKFDLQGDIEIPDFIMGNIKQDQQYEKLQIISQNQYGQDNSLSSQHDHRNTINYEYFKRFNDYSVENHQNEPPEISQYFDEQELPDQIKNSINSKQPNKKNLSAKRYRQKKREELKALQIQNRFLRKKVDDLTFRLNQAEILINKLQHGESVHTNQLQTMKQQLIHQAEKILAQKTTQKQQIQQMEQKFRSLTCFDGKQRVSLLNYYMGELLQNIIDDRAIYFLDCMLTKRGVYKQSKQTPLRKIDKQVFQVMGILDDESKQKLMKRQISPLLQDSAKRFKKTWQSLYQNYLKLLHEGFTVQSLVQPLKKRVKNHLQVQIFLKVELYFQKIKYRSDLRQLRQAWFKDLDTKEQVIKQKSNNNPIKKAKI